MSIRNRTNRRYGLNGKIMKIGLLSLSVVFSGSGGHSVYSGRQARIQAA